MSLPKVSDPRDLVRQLMFDDAMTVETKVTEKVGLTVYKLEGELCVLFQIFRFFTG